jgi:hypothetical protein
MTRLPRASVMLRRQAPRVARVSTSTRARSAFLGDLVLVELDAEDLLAAVPFRASSVSGPRPSLGDRLRGVLRALWRR